MLESFFSPSFSMMLIRLVINLVVVSIIIDRLYYPKSKRRDFYFTFMLISIAIFFIVFWVSVSDSSASSPSCVTVRMRCPSVR